MNPYKILILLLFTLTTLWGNLKLSIPSNTIIKNEPFIFVLEAFGDDIKFPNIDLINAIFLPIRHINDLPKDTNMKQLKTK